MLHAKFVNNGTLIFFVVIKSKNLIRKNLKLFRYSETDYNIVLLFNKININFKILICMHRKNRNLIFC